MQSNLFISGVTFCSFNLYPKFNFFLSSRQFGRITKWKFIMGDEFVFCFVLSILYSIINFQIYILKFGTNSEKKPKEYLWNSLKTNNRILKCLKAQICSCGVFSVSILHLQVQGNSMRVLLMPLQVFFCKQYK